MFFVVFSIRLIVKASFRGYNGTNRSGCSRRARYLGMTAAIPQVPVPTAIEDIFGGVPWLFPFLIMMKQVKFYCHRNTSSDSKSVLLRITGTGTLVLRWGDIEAITQGELDATGIVVIHLAKHKTIAVKGKAVDAAVEEVVTCQFDVEAAFEEILADTEREHRLGAVEPGVLLIAVSVHVEVGLQEPVVGQGDDVAQL